MGKIRDQRGSGSGNFYPWRAGTRTSAPPPQGQCSWRRGQASGPDVPQQGSCSTINQGQGRTPGPEHYMMDVDPVTIISLTEETEDYQVSGCTTSFSDELESSLERNETVASTTEDHVSNVHSATEVRDEDINAGEFVEEQNPVIFISASDENVADPVPGCSKAMFASVGVHEEVEDESYTEDLIEDTILLKDMASNTVPSETNFEPVEGLEDGWSSNANCVRLPQNPITFIPASEPVEVQKAKICFIGPGYLRSFLAGEFTAFFNQGPENVHRRNSEDLKEFLDLDDKVEDDRFQVGKFVYLIDCDCDKRMKMDQTMTDLTLLTGRIKFTAKLLVVYCRSEANTSWKSQMTLNLRQIRRRFSVETQHLLKDNPAYVRAFLITLKKSLEMNVLGITQ